MSQTRKYFGTDGIRGNSKDAFFEASFLQSLGLVIAQYLREKSDSPKLLMGRDTRVSGERIFRHLSEGLQSGGVKVFDAGIVPTPAIACGILEFGCDFGIVITASHNPAEDNGIKLFNEKGTKFSDEFELMIESRLEKTLSQSVSVESLTEPPESLLVKEVYERNLIDSFDEKALDSWKIVLDTANGATSLTSLCVLESLGAEVIHIGSDSDGSKINLECGSEHPEKMSALVKEHGASIGIAHDGDGDRLILCDETGEVVDGDAILALLGKYLIDNGRLAHLTLVATVMSNLGLDEAIEASGGKVFRSNVGDRYILQAMKEYGYNFGGEASGHIVFQDYSPTGDGLSAAVMVLKVMLETGKSLSELKRAMRFFPQLKQNLLVEQKIPFEEIKGFSSKLAEIESTFKGRGRILLRYSGTEAKIRLLSEADSVTEAESAMKALDELVRSELKVLS